MYVLGNLNVAIHPVFKIPAGPFNYLQHPPEERVGTVQEEPNNNTKVVDDKQEWGSDRHVTALDCMRSS